jgi:small neutral amino acid transporter SnatA (MarC family)
MHSAAVTHVVVAPNVMWVFLACVKGVLQVFAISQHALELAELPCLPDPTRWRR